MERETETYLILGDASFLLFSCTAMIGSSRNIEKEDHSLVLFVGFDYLTWIGKVLNVFLIFDN